VGGLAFTAGDGLRATAAGADRLTAAAARRVGVPFPLSFETVSASAAARVAAWHGWQQSCPARRMAGSLPRQQA
jgi:hypothetical protein